jgi:putative flippase GtrA
VSAISGLYRRFRQLIHEGAKFLVVGLIGTIVTFGLANALQGSIGRYPAITIATVVATVVTYLGNGRWAFNKRQGQGTARDTVVFFVLNAIGLLIYYACIGLTDAAGVGHSKFWYNMALVVGTGLGTLFRFWSYRKWVGVAADTPVLTAEEPAEDRAQDLAAMIGASPITHHSSGEHGDSPGEDGDKVPGRARTQGAHRRA